MSIIKDMNTDIQRSELEEKASEGDTMAQAELNALDIGLNESDFDEDMKSGYPGDNDDINDVVARIADHFKSMDMIDTLPDDELAEAIGKDLEDVAGLENEDQKKLIKRIVGLVRK